MNLSTKLAKSVSLQRQLYIAIVDDDEDDRSFLYNALSANGSQYKVVEFEDGEQFLDAMKQPDAIQKTADTCALIILDVNMHKISGLEVLDAIKEQAELRHIPVVMFSTSTDKGLIFNSFQKGASSYLQKPNRMEDYKQVVQSLQTCFLTLPCVRLTNLC